MAAPHLPNRDAPLYAGGPQASDGYYEFFRLIASRVGSNGSLTTTSTSLQLSVSNHETRIALLEEGGDLPEVLQKLAEASGLGIPRRLISGAWQYLGQSTDAMFLRGDHTWSNTLLGPMGVGIAPQVGEMFVVNGAGLSRVTDSSSSSYLEVGDGFAAGGGDGDFYVFDDGSLSYYNYAAPLSGAGAFRGQIHLSPEGWFYVESGQGTTSGLKQIQLIEDGWFIGGGSVGSIEGSYNAGNPIVGISAAELHVTTITLGTWNATAIGLAYGGTGQDYSTRIANTVWAGPTTGADDAPAFRALVAADIPSLSSIYQPLDGTLTALAAANWVANALPIGTGADTLAQTTFAANTFPARASTGNLVAKTISDDALAFVAAANDGAMRTELGLGTVATLASDTDTALAANSDSRVATQKATKAYVDAAAATAAALIVDSIADSDTTHAPSRNAVFDALALKAPLASPTFTGDHKVSEADFLTGDISPTALAAATNDWAPTGFATCSVIRASCSAVVALTGLAGGADGRRVTIHNVGSFDLLLTANDGGSSAGNQFKFTQPIILQPDRSLVLWYDSTSTAWRLEGNAPKCKTKLSGDQTNNNATPNTLQDVTGLSFPVISGKTYRFRFAIYYTSAVTGTGSRWTVSGPTFTALSYDTELMNTTVATRLQNGSASAWDVAVVSAASPNEPSGGGVVGPFPAWVTGFVTPSADGTVIARFASEAGSSAVIAKATVSCVEYECIG